MSGFIGKRSSTHEASGTSAAPEPSIGKLTLVEQEYAKIQRTAVASSAGPNEAVQRREGGAQSADHVQETAATGVSGAGTTLPHLDLIQRAFGRHDVSGIQAHVGGPAATASDAIGANAYAT